MTNTFSISEDFFVLIQFGRKQKQITFCYSNRKKMLESRVMIFATEEMNGSLVKAKQQKKIANKMSVLSLLQTICSYQLYSLSKCVKITSKTLEFNKCIQVRNYSKNEIAYIEQAIKIHSICLVCPILAEWRNYHSNRLTHAHGHTQTINSGELRNKLTRHETYLTKLPF